MARWAVRPARSLLALLLALLAPILGAGSASAQGPDGPWFEASLASPWINGCQFADDVQVVVIDAGTERLRTTAQLKPDGCFEVIPSFQLRSGMEVTVTDGTTTRTLTLVELSIEGVNPETDIAWGLAPASTDALHVDSFLGTTWAETFPTVDDTGHWTADFAAVGADLVPGNDLGADIWSDYAATVYDVAVPPNVDDLASVVNDLVPPPLTKPLNQKLQVVEQTLEEDRVTAGITLLHSYVSQVQGLARSGKISAEVKAQLVGSANDLIIGLGG